MIGRAVVAPLVAALLLPAVAGADRAKRPWPPIPQRGALFVHYGEEHWNDDDGLRILPKVVRDTARYRPNLVSMSADKDDDNAVESLEMWKEVMSRYDRRGIPYFAAVGNHDRSQPGTEGIGSSLLGGDISNYLDVFADRAYPFGDAAPPSDPRFRPKNRPASDPDGTSTHYALTYGRVRWVFLDNSCFSFINCDAYQNPAFPDQAGNASTYDFLASEATKANDRGQLLFVVMHMPTEDDRPLHTEPTPSAHTMGEGSSPDNALFEQAAAAAGVDAVLVGHIKGQWQYMAGGVPYYTDGGAGGEVYVGPFEDAGVDSGYWHGYRLIWVRRGRVRATDTVPVFSPGGITLDGPGEVARGSIGQFSAVGDQPTAEGPEVNNLELREPDPSRPNADNLTTPARIWRTGDRRILKPVAAADDDPRRKRRRETVSGRFRGRCPGVGSVRITSGWETQRLGVTVPSKPGRIVRSTAGGGELQLGDERTVAAVILRQRARVLVRIRRNGRILERLVYRCVGAGSPFGASWDGTRDGDPVAPGVYRAEIRVLSDRSPIIDRFKVRVTP